MTVLLVLVVAISVVAVGCAVVMSRRDEALFGQAAIGLLMLAAILGVAYGIIGAE